MAPPGLSVYADDKKLAGTIYWQKKETVGTDSRFAPQKDPQDPGGLLLVPEASSSCTCNFALQTSIAFRPVRAEPAHKSSSANKNKRPQVAAPK